MKVLFGTPRTRFPWSTGPWSTCFFSHPSFYFSGLESKIADQVSVNKQLRLWIGANPPTDHDSNGLVGVLTTFRVPDGYSKLCCLENPQTWDQDAPPMILQLRILKSATRGKIEERQGENGRQTPVLSTKMARHTRLIIRGQLSLTCVSMDSTKLQHRSKTTFAIVRGTVHSMSNSFNHVTALHIEFSS
jgi:hypothetical protein